MHAFKHVPRRFADAFLAGEQISICTYSYYREMEGDRGDPFEGRVVNFQPPGQSLDARSPEIAQVVALQGGIYISPFTEGFVFENCTFTTSLPNQYIFCASSKPDFEHAEINDERIFRISDIKEYGRLLRRANSEFLGNPTTGVVQYKLRTSAIGQAPLVMPNPFEKDEKFSVENEIRVVFSGEATGSSQRIISAPKAGKLTREIFRE